MEVVMSKDEPEPDDDLTPEVPVIDEDRIRQVHEEIQGMVEIKLDADPLSVGPKMMNNKKAAVRNQLGRCTQIELQLLEDRGWFQRELTREQAKYEIKQADLFTHNPHVRARQALTDRVAATNVLLAKSVRHIKDLELAVEDLERLLKVVVTKVRDLKNLQSQLRDQLKVCEHELGLGGKWGQFSPVSPTGEGPVTAADVAVVDELIESVGGDEEEDEEGPTLLETYEEAVAEVEESDESEPILAGSATTSETDSALDDIDGEGDDDAESESEGSDPANVDVDEILNGLDFDS